MATTSHHHPAHWASLFLAGRTLVEAGCQLTESPARRLIPCFHISLALPFMDLTRTTNQPRHQCAFGSTAFPSALMLRIETIQRKPFLSVDIIISRSKSLNNTSSGLNSFVTHSSRQPKCTLSVITPIPCKQPRSISVRTTSRRNTAGRVDEDSSLQTERTGTTE